MLLTHGHLDHSEGARAFAERVGCGVRALDPAHRLGAEGLRDGDVVAVGGLEMHVVGTPGHTSDSLSFVLPAERAVLTGDTVLGRGTTVVAHPDGKLGAYLDSLAAAARAAPRQRGHHRSARATDRCIDDALAALDHYLAHRANGWSRCARPSRGLGPDGPPRAGRGAGSTSTSTRSSGAPPSSPSAPSWTTSRSPETGDADTDDAEYGEMPVRRALPTRRGRGWLTAG